MRVPKNNTLSAGNAAAAFSVSARRALSDTPIGYIREIRGHSLRKFDFRRFGL